MSVPNPVEVVTPKPAWWSKINWVSIVSIIIGLGDLIAANFQLSAQTLATILTVQGSLTLIMRTFFTTKPLSLSSDPQPRIVE